eukprot:8740957-Pyramimonas_sp.AAC.2
MGGDSTICLTQFLENVDPAHLDGRVLADDSISTCISGPHESCLDYFVVANLRSHAVENLQTNLDGPLKPRRPAQLALGMATQDIMVLVAEACEKVPNGRVQGPVREPPDYPGLQRQLADFFGRCQKGD